MNIRAFTLIETVIFFLIVAIIGTIAIPKYFSLRQEAKNALEDMTVSSVRSGIKIFSVDQMVKGLSPIYPPGLDAATNNPASALNPFFTAVLETPVTENMWNKLGTSLYKGPSGKYYYYDPKTGDFSKCGNDSTLANLAELYTYVPSQSVSNYNHSIWAVSDGGLYSPWSGYPLNFPFSFPNAGTYHIDLYAINNANHPDFTSGLGQDARTDWHLPNGYTNFNVQVSIDGTRVSPANFNIAASDSQTNSNGFDVYIPAGNHTLTLVWTNDSWDPNNHGDANIQFQNITIQRTGS